MRTRLSKSMIILIIVVAGLLATRTVLAQGQSSENPSASILGKLDQIIDTLTPRELQPNSGLIVDVTTTREAPPSPSLAPASTSQECGQSRT